MKKVKTQKERERVFVCINERSFNNKNENMFVIFHLGGWLEEWKWRTERMKIRNCFHSILIGFTQDITETEKNKKRTQTYTNNGRMTKKHEVYWGKKEV